MKNSLDLSNWNTSAATNMGCMIESRYDLKSVELSSFDTFNATDMSCMLYLYSSLETLDLSNFDTSNTAYMNYILFYNKKLEKFGITSFDFSNVIGVFDMLESCQSLTNLKFRKNLKVSIDLADCPLAHESTISVIIGLADVKEQQILWLSAKTYDTLSLDDIKLTKDKNWKTVYRDNDDEI